jgi:ribosomal protein S16
LPTQVLNNKGRYQPQARRDQEVRVRQQQAEQAAQRGEGTTDSVRHEIQFLEMIYDF